MTPIRETIARAITDDAWDATYEMGRTSLPITGGAAHIPEREAGRIADAVLRALDEAGCVVVPKEASEAMVEAHMAECAGDADEAGPDRIRKAWRAMISDSVVE